MVWRADPGNCSLICRTSVRGLTYICTRRDPTLYSEVFTMFLYKFNVAAEDWVL